MSGPETWGAWSNDDFVNITFTEALPARFELRISAQAFAHNIGKQFVLLLDTPGTGKKPAGTFVLGPEAEERTVIIDNPINARTLSIKVPAPVAPLELGATDDRRLGIAIHKMQIIPVGATPSVAGK